MTCNRTSLRKIGRKKYSLVANLPQAQSTYVSNKNIELENLIVEVIDSDSKTVAFSTPFSSTPSVVANFVKVTGDANVSVYVVSVTNTNVVIRMSSPVTGQIHVHAMYIES